MLDAYREKKWGFVPDYVLAHILERRIVFQKQPYHLQRVRYIPALERAVTDLRRVDRAPLLVSADPLDEELLN